MKKCICRFMVLAVMVLAMGVGAFADVAINATNFPDANFREYVSRNFDTNSDGSLNGSLSSTEIASARRIEVPNKDIYSLKGIEYFTALTSLRCNNNQRLKAIDVSKNTALTYLDCWYNKLTALDVSKNTALTHLYCVWNQLTALDVSSNTALTELYCNLNQITTLDLSKNTALTQLSCGNNQLTALDVSKNTALTQLYCGNNQLTALDVSKNTALTQLSCGGNQLTTLDLSKNTALAGLYCNDNQITTLDLSKNTALTHLYCWNNQLTALGVSKNTALTHLFCYGNQITTLDLSKNTDLTYLYCDFTITSADNTFTFNIADFMEAYKSLDDGLSSVDFRYYYDSEYSNLTLNPEQIAANNVVSFTIPEGKTFSYIYMTLTYSNSSNKYVRVYPSGSSPDTTDLDNPYDPDNPYDSDSSNIAPIITTSSLPSASVDVQYSANLSALGSSPITWTLASGDLPNGLTLSSSGNISGTPTTPGASSFTATASNSAGSASKLFTILVPFSADRSPKITTTSLNTAYTDSPYGFKLTASGTIPLTWSLAQGSSLPDGLTLTTSGYIYGTPTTADTTAFTVYASNSAGTASKDFSFTVNESPTRTRPAVMTEDPYPATQGEEYICQLVALGTPPFTWTAKKKLPKGLNMTPSGLITGTPTKAKKIKSPSPSQTITAKKQEPSR